MTKKRIVCYGDSNTWGYCAATGQRYDDDIRWTQQLQELLGKGYQVVEEGLTGRTTVFEDPLCEGLCGIAALTPILKSHAPLDLLVLMLGTNDCKQRFCATAQNIADGAKRIIHKARELNIWREQPRLLLAAPVMIDPRVEKVPYISQEMGAQSAQKSSYLPLLYKALAQQEGCAFFDSNQFASVGPADYMHFDEQSQSRFAAGLYHKILEIL